MAIPEIVFNNPIITVGVTLIVLFVLMSVVGSLVGITLDIVGSVFGLIVGILFILAILQIAGIQLIDHPTINPFVDLFASFLVELFNLFKTKLFQG